MPTKAKTQKKQETITETITAEPVQSANGKGEYKLIDRRLIHSSPTNPRKNFDAKSLDELASSIRRVGIQQPVLVRPLKALTPELEAKFNDFLAKEKQARAARDEAQKHANENPGDKSSRAYARLHEKYAETQWAVSRLVSDGLAGYGFELIAGERRWRAAEIAGLDEIPAIVREVSDTEAFEIQIIENLQRRDIEPLDEAAGFKNLMEKAGYTVTDIALRVGKPESFILQRLLLNKLSEQAQKRLAAGELPIGHALEIAKYPQEAHDELLPHCYNNFGYDSQTLYPLKKFIERIEQHYLLQLKKAPFSTKSTELRKDGLACVKCPERTNANPLLFAENYSDKDCCLNRTCWAAKTEAHIQIQRRKVAETDLGVKEPEQLDKAVSKIPLLSGKYYLCDDEKPKEKYLDRDSFRELEKKDECEFAERGVFFNGDRIGQSAWICRSPKCETHSRSGMISVGGASADPEAQREARLIRKEEIFNSRVAEAVRRKVLRKVAEKFDAANTIYTHENADGWQTELLARLWKLQCANSDHTAKVICEALGLDDKQLSTSRWGADFREEILNLSPDVRSRLLFLLLVAYQCEIFEAYWSYESQKPIQDLAADFEVDYQLIDAEERLGQIPMKLKSVFRNYLEEIQKGNRKAKAPRAYSEKWKPKK